MKEPENKKTAMVHVLGCKVNQAEAAAMSKALEEKGYRIDPSPSDPDLVVVNTCCVTSRAEGKSRRAVSRLAGKYPDASILVTGCLAEVNPESIREIPGSSVCLGTVEKDRFTDFLDMDLSSGNRVIRAGAERAETFGDLDSTPIPGRSRAFLKVQDGCSQRCTYCIVPTSRGPSRSIPLQRALASARSMEINGVSEVVLSGIHLGHYGKDLAPETRLEDLIESLIETCPGVRFRISSVEPPEITERLMDLVATHPRVCRHFHIPLQSGDNRILRRMGRPYNIELINGLMDGILSRAQETCVGLDLMVGFPGEDDASFRRTLSFVERSGAAYLHVFPFSPRPGTPAASFKPRVPHSIASERTVELRALSDKLRRAFYQQSIGNTLPAVMESNRTSEINTAVVRTDNYIPAHLNCLELPQRNGIFSVVLEEVRDDRVFARLAPEE